MRELKNVEKDALKEMESIGAGKASDELSKLIGKKVVLTVPETVLLSKDQIEQAAGGPENMVIGIYAPISGGVSGNLMIAFQKKDALMLIDLLKSQEPGATEILEKDGKKELKKLGNALISSYAGPLEDFLELRVSPGTVGVISTFGRSLGDFLAFNVEEEDILLIKTEFRVPGTGIKGDFAFLLAFASIDTLIDAINKKL